MIQQIDWPGIRANAMSIGVRAAARQAAAHLPPIEQARFVSRALKRSDREGWITAKIQAQTDAKIQVTNNLGAKPKPLSSTVFNGADGMALHLAEASKQTRLNLVKATGNAAKSLSERAGEAVVKSSKALRDITAAATQLHGWEAKAGVTLNVGIQLGKMT